MEEKKLTDEEIIKALVNCAKELNGCDKCPVKEHCCDTSNTILLLYALDLIHRLQAENERLKYEETQREDILQAVKNSTKVLVSSPIGDLPMNINGLKKAVDYISKQKAEIERLTDKLGKVLSGIKADELLVAKGIEQAVKDTAKEILTEFNEWINWQYDAKLDTYSVHIPVHEVNDFLTDKAKEYGVEVE